MPTALVDTALRLSARLLRGPATPGYQRGATDLRGDNTLIRETFEATYEATVSFESMVRAHAGNIPATYLRSHPRSSEHNFNTCEREAAVGTHIREQQATSQALGSHQRSP